MKGRFEDGGAFAESRVLLGVKLGHTMVVGALGTEGHLQSRGCSWDIYWVLQETLHPKP